MKNATYRIDLSSKPISSLFYVGDFAQRTELSVFFMIKTNACRSVSLCMHTHVFIYTCILVQGRNLMGQEIQRIKSYSCQMAQQSSWEINLSSLIFFRAMFGYFCCKLLKLQGRERKGMATPFYTLVSTKGQGPFSECLQSQCLQEFVLQSLGWFFSSWRCKHTAIDNLI